MILSEYIKEHKGEVVRIGTKNGAGFVFAGTVDSFTLNRIERVTHVKMHDRDVLEVYPSAFVGSIVLVNGTEYGREESPEFDRLPISDEVPIENYQRLVDFIAESAAQDYEHALVLWYCSPSEKAKQNADATIVHCERFFRSDMFATLMPNANGEDILRLIEKKVKRDIGVNDDE